MRPARSRARFLLVLSAVLAVAGLQCDPFHPPIDPGPVPIVIDRSTRDSLIQFFTRAHSERNIDQYSESLHPDYTFWFWEFEGIPNPFPNDWIDRTLDIEVTRNMFNAGTVTSITLDLTNLTPEDPVHGRWIEEYLPAGGDSTMVAYWAEFLVDLHVIVQETETEIDRWVNGRADIHVARDPNFMEQGYWTIWKIRDRTAEHKSGAGGEWTGMKGEFR